jgi:hypothetical protein
MTGLTDSIRKDVQFAIQYQFRDSNLLDLALTHGSAGQGQDNQRLEYLGDALLNFCVARLIYQEQPNWPEGAMSKLRGMLVCTDALHHWALESGLSLATGTRAPKQPGALRKPLADAVEALLASIYLDVEESGSRSLRVVIWRPSARRTWACGNMATARRPCKRRRRSLGFQHPAMNRFHGPAPTINRPSRCGYPSVNYKRKPMRATLNRPRYSRRGIF